MLLDRLRQESRPHHVRLEESVGLAASVEHHRVIVRGFFGFIEPWEKSVLASPFSYLLSDRQKSGWLHNDLGQIGLTDDDIARLPRCKQLPAVDTLPEVLGSLYVIEGSTLGGQMISKHLEKRFGFSEGRGYSYFRSYGAGTHAKWQEFRQTLLEHSGPDADDLIVASAQNTFSLLHRWFSPASLTA